ncbi:MAG: hypothetical protein KKE17_15630 [Proteobacteria bacterium]|nr:hypothetical protein [Pseudomonadota bacterium]
MAMTKNEFWVVGTAYFIRTVTNYFIGVCIGKEETELFMNKCSWIPDTGHFHKFVRTGIIQEVEPFNADTVVMLNCDAIVDAIEWKHEIPTDAK